MTELEMDIKMRELFEGKEIKYIFKKDKVSHTTSTLNYISIVMEDGTRLDIHYEDTFGGMQITESLAL